MNTTAVSSLAVKTAIDTYVPAYINNDYLALSDLSEGEGLDIILEALVAGDVQVRDYFLGLPNQYGIGGVAQAVSNLVLLLPAGQKRSLNSVLAFFSYEAGDTDYAVRLVELALAEDDEYTLAKLIKRVIQAGWAPEVLQEARNDCHAKVAEILEHDYPIKVEE